MGILGGNGWTYLASMTEGAKTEAEGAGVSGVLALVRPLRMGFSRLSGLD